MNKPTENIVQSTINYNQFKGVIGNREIYQPHLRRLRKSVEYRNLLPQNPIIVNEKMEVIDGQHRLLVAKELGLPIYYSIVKNADLTEIQMLNANARPWLTQDYLDSYIAMGKKEYIAVQEFADEHRISVSIAIQLLGDSFTKGGGDRKKVLEGFRQGTFMVKDRERAERIASLIEEVRKHSPDRAWQHHDCIKALVILQNKIDPKVLIRQLEQYRLVITRRVSVNDYLRQFENIINTNSQGKPTYLAQ